MKKYLTNLKKKIQPTLMGVLELFPKIQTRACGVSNKFRECFTIKGILQKSKEEVLKFRQFPEFENVIIEDNFSMYHPEDIELIFDEYKKLRNETMPKNIKYFQAQADFCNKHEADMININRIIESTMDTVADANKLLTAYLPWIKPSFERDYLERELINSNFIEYYLNSSPKPEIPTPLKLKIISYMEKIGQVNYARDKIQTKYSLQDLTSKIRRLRTLSQMIEARKADVLSCPTEDITSRIVKAVDEMETEQKARKEKKESDKKRKKADLEETIEASA